MTLRDIFVVALKNDPITFAIVKKETEGKYTSLRRVSLNCIKSIVLIAIHLQVYQNVYVCL